MYRRIAVPLDGTVASRQAIPWAVTIARKAQCPVELIHVAFPAVVGTELYAAAVQPSDVEAIREAAQRDLQSLADQLTSNGIASTATALTGEVPHALADHLEPSDTDLVIMTTHDASRLERLLVGSVSESVVRHIHVPVLLVHQDEATPVAIDAPRAITRMLIPLDGSPFGDEILRHAANLAALLTSEMTLLGVLQPILAVAAMATDVGGPNAALMAMKTREEHPDAEQTEAHALVLEQTASSLRATGMTVHTGVVVDGQPARAIVDYAKRHAMDAIAMTTHGRGALKRILAGSVSRRVLRTSHVPMLMYRPAEHHASSK